MRERKPKILLVVAPNIVEAHKTAQAYGIDPVICAGLLRTVTHAHRLRGWSQGTPVIFTNRATWGRSAEALALDTALDAYLRTGRLRLAGDADISELQGEMRA